MCGIVGILGNKPAVMSALSVLRRLEYRGYDSAGLAVVGPMGFDRRRAVGKLAELDALLAEEPIDGATVIGHTRWATHGAPTVANAHPHRTHTIQVVHNGIIENYKQLKDTLLAEGFNFESDTDTEVIAALMQYFLDAGRDPVGAFHAAVDQLEGAFALAVIVDGRADLLMGARKGSPLVVGIGEDSLFLCSDAIGLAGLTNRVIYLDEGDRVILHDGKVKIATGDGIIVQRPTTMIDVETAPLDKGRYRHFMLKEIHEQPDVVQSSLSRYLDFGARAIDLGIEDAQLSHISQVTLVACGTSFYAALVAQYWIESIAGIPVRTEIASEFRYGDCVMLDGGLCVFISQSGETADTLAALKHAKQLGQRTLALVNVITSSIAREADMVLEIGAGPEIGVASTKAFTCQLSVLAVFTLDLAQRHRGLSDRDKKAHMEDLRELPQAMASLITEIEASSTIDNIADRLARASYILFIGRGPLLPIALEGALKLKEITYIPAEGYAAGELKHGPISLVDENVPVIGMVSASGHSIKTQSNLEEVMARGGQVHLIADHDPAIEGLRAVIKVPAGSVLSAPILMTIPAQLLAYHTAVRKGTDVDQPRNLAKSVTVE